MYGRVVVRACVESRLCETLSLFKCSSCTLLFDDVEERLVLLLARHNDNILEILCACPNEGNATYIDFLNDSRLVVGCCHSLFKGIKINNYEVYFRYLIFLHLLLVGLDVSSCKDASKNFGVQCLNSPSEDRRIGCMILHFLTFISQALNETLCPSC